MEDGKKDTIKVLEKMLLIMETIIKNPQPLGVNEISKITGVHPSTVYRILRSLKKNGWVYQDKNEKYQNGNKIYSMSTGTNYSVLKEVAYYVMRKCSASEMQAMNLVVREYNKCFILQQTRTFKLMDYVPPIGTELPVYASACGKVLLSELPESILQEILQLIEFKNYTKYTINNKADLIRDLVKIKESGYALDLHESLEQAACIAVPVRNEDGITIAALSFSGFVGGFEEKDIDYYFRILKEASKAISQKLALYQQELSQK